MRNFPSAVRSTPSGWTCWGGTHLGSPDDEVTDKRALGDGSQFADLPAHGKSFGHLAEARLPSL